MIYTISMIILVAINLSLTKITKVYTAKLSYDFILTYIGAIGLFLFFNQINIKSNKINLLSALTLGIYLIHEHPFVRSIIYKNINKHKLFLDDWYIVYIILIVAMIYCISSTLEYIRIKIFKFISMKMRGVKIGYNFK